MCLCVCAPTDVYLWLFGTRISIFGEQTILKLGWYNEMIYMHCSAIFAMDRGLVLKIQIANLIVGVMF